MARNFNGTTDRIDYTTVLSPGAHSLFMWVLVDTLKATWLWVVHNAGDASARWIFYVDANGKLTPQAGTYRRTSDTLSTGVWTHIGYTYDNSGLGTGFHVYINGTECSYEAAGNGVPGSVLGSWSLGGRIYDDARNFDGKLANVGYWSRVLTAGEIAALAATYDATLISEASEWAPSLKDGYDDPVTGQAGTADGTSDFTHPPTLYNGYRIYDNDGAGPMNYVSVRATRPATLATWVSDALAYPGSWRFGVRAVNAYGEEKNFAVKKLSLDATGADVTAKPNHPTEFSVAPLAAGEFRLEWAYNTTGQGATPTHFNIYHDAGTGTVDYATVIDTVTLTSGVETHYRYDTSGGAFTDGETYRFAVRAATAADAVEDGNILTVSATADATAPVQPASLTATATR